MSKLTDEISDYVVYGKPLVDLKTTYVEAARKLELYMDVFLEKHGSKIMGDRDNSPEWKLYDRKCAEYSELSNAIRTVDYYLSKDGIKANVAKR